MARTFLTFVLFVLFSVDLDQYCQSASNSAETDELVEYFWRQNKRQKRRNKLGYNFQMFHLSHLLCAPSLITAQNKEIKVFLRRIKNWSPSEVNIDISRNNPWLFLVSFLYFPVVLLAQKTIILRLFLFTVEAFVNRHLRDAKKGSVAGAGRLRE